MSNRVDYVTQEEIFCFKPNIDAGLCNETQFGEFILKPDTDALKTSPIRTQAIRLDNPEPINYPITKTGYYCVWTYHFSDAPYHGAVEFRNSYGELPAAQIPKLPFYGGLTIVYAVIGAFWAFLYVQNRQDILPVQNYITAIVIFLIVEQLITWGYYDYQNRNGNNAGTKALLIVTAILNAARNSFSFFLLLITCMGYGIVKPSLGKTMLYVRILALVHFVFGVIYGIASLAVTPDSAGPLLLLVIVPLAASLTAFYVWTLNSLSATLKDLIDRKQSVKAMMYRRLWWCILGSILVIFAFFFFNSFTFARRSDPDFVPNNWKTRWFVLDGWLNLVYLFDIAFIAYLWRPTANNRRFAMSDEVSRCLAFSDFNECSQPRSSLRTTTATSKLPRLAALLTRKATTPRYSLQHSRTHILHLRIGTTMPLAPKYRWHSTVVVRSMVRPSSLLARMGTKCRTKTRRKLQSSVRSRKKD